MKPQINATKGLVSKPAVNWHRASGAEKTPVDLSFKAIPVKGKVFPIETADVTTQEANLLQSRTPTLRKLSHSEGRNLNARRMLATIRPVHGGYSSVG